MTLGLRIREASEVDLPAVKQLVDRHRLELGFVPLPALKAAQRSGLLMVAEVDGPVVGMLNWWRRRDHVYVLYNLAVDAAVQGRGIGHALLTSLVARARADEIRAIQLKCPVDLAANAFYVREGFTLDVVEPGKRRALNCWKLAIG